MAVLEAKNLVKQYDLGDHSVVALAGVDIVIENGEFVAIMGPSGSGKSTLLHLLGGLDQPSQGEVFIANHRMSVLDDTQATLVRRHNVGFVFQFFNLLPNLTAEENINLPIIIDGQNPRDYEGKLTTLLRLVGLSDRRNHKPDQLSGGEQQRVSMARALLTEPAVLWQMSQQATWTPRPAWRLWNSCSARAGSYTRPPSLSLTTRKPQPMRTE